MYNVIVCFVHAICMFVICSVHQTHGFKFRLIRNGWTCILIWTSKTIIRSVIDILGPLK